MEQLEQIHSLLCKKRDIFQKYEQSTIVLQTCDAEQVEGHMDIRQGCIGQIDQIDLELSQLLKELPEGPQLAKLIRNKYDAEEIPGKWETLSNAAKEIFSVMNRISRAEVQALANIEDQKKNLLKKIKAANQSPEAQVSKYYSKFGGPQQTGRSGFGKA